MLNKTKKHEHIIILYILKNKCATTSYTEGVNIEVFKIASATQNLHKALWKSSPMPFLRENEYENKFLHMTFYHIHVCYVPRPEYAHNKQHQN